MRRRDLLLGAGGAFVAPLAAGAQEQRTIRKIGWLSLGIRSNKTELLNAFLGGLQDLGYVLGRDLVVEQRDADGRVERLPEIAAELVRFGVNVIVTTEGVPATTAAKNATPSIPIVMAEAGDPVKTGLVASLAHPGGNVTGLSVGDDLPEKRLQLLKEMSPGITRTAAFYNPAFPANLLWIKDAQGAAATLGLSVVPVEVLNADELNKAFAGTIASGVDSLLTFGDPFTSNQQSLILAVATQHRLPALHFLREFAESGGLASYGVSFSALYRRAAIYVDKLLKGAHPSDLPVEQPTKIELVINLKAAKALGLTLSHSFLLRADEVIE